VNIGVPDVLRDVLVLVCVTYIFDNARRGRGCLAASRMDVGAWVGLW